MISQLFQILRLSGYQKDKGANKGVSHTHDVSHGIYGTGADFLVTADIRFSKRCEAVYFYLGVPTKVVCVKPENIIEKIKQIVKE